MKKVVSIIMMVVIVMMSSIAMANSSEILMHTYSWWKESHQDIYERFLETVYSYEGFEYNGIVYYAGDVYLDIHEYMSVKEIEKYFDDLFLKNANIATSTKVNVIGQDCDGRRIFEIDIITDSDLRFINGSNIYSDNPVYGVYYICYDGYNVQY